MQHYATRPERASGLNQFMTDAINQYANLGLGQLDPRIQQAGRQGMRGEYATQLMQEQAKNLMADPNWYMPRVQQAAQGTAAQGTAAQPTYDPRIAQQIMAGSPVEQAITAGTRDIYRNLAESQLPGIGLGAAGAQQTGGSRRAVAEGIAARGAQDRAADVAGQMYNQAYGQGVGVGSQYGLTGAGFQQGMNLANLGNLQQMGLANLGTQQQTLMANMQAINRAKEFNRNLGLQRQGLAARNLGQISGQWLPASQFGLGMETAQPDYLMRAGQTQLNAPWEYAQRFGQAALPWAIPGAPGMPQQNPWTTPQGLGAAMGGLGGVFKGLGAIGAAGGFGALSDERLKANLRPIQKVGPLTEYSWTWNKAANDIGHYGDAVGFVAQEVQQHYPQHVHERNSYLTIDYPALMAELTMEVRHAI